MQQQSEEHQQNITAPSTTNKNRGFLSWILTNNKKLSPPFISSARHTNLIKNSGLAFDDHHLKAKVEVPDDIDAVKSYECTEFACTTIANSVTEISTLTTVISSSETIANPQPDQQQSQLYTISHGREEEREEEPTTLFEYNHKAYSATQHSPSINVMDNKTSNSTSLTRSATWQPSSSSLPPPPPVPPHGTLFPLSSATEDMIPTRRTSRNYSDNPEIQAKLSAVLNSQKTLYLSNMIQSNPNMYRRSTTPKSRKL
ncbi:hypothetical protein [Parasitella parasitica]|uniref:Uncharacterized protein n=1 Tax=Parasitella parasitica TaxID=35722 RepID=A0A0B7NU39_9FUNG|nr:hypothetical protein [Parasitella parasitica]